MSKNVMPFQELQGAAIHRDAKLDQVIHHTHQQVHWWQGMGIQLQRIKRGNGKALMDNISKLLNFDYVKSSGAMAACFSEFSFR